MILIPSCRDIHKSNVLTLKGEEEYNLMQSVFIQKCLGLLGGVWCSSTMVSGPMCGGFWILVRSMWYFESPFVQCYRVRSCVVFCWRSLVAWGFCIVFWVFCKQVRNEKTLMALGNSCSAKDLKSVMFFFPSLN